MLFATNKTKETKPSKKVKQNNEKKHNKKKINSTETKIYLFRTFWWQYQEYQEMISTRKCFPKSSRCVMDKGELFSQTLIFIVSTKV